MTAVLGTAVRPAPNDAPVALLVSDLHLPADGGPTVAALHGALAAARRLGAALFVLGDLFDSYVCRAQVRHGVWRDVAGAFAAATAAGVPIVVLHGNRDFMLGSEFAAASRATVVAGGLRGRLGGVDTLLLHGDELCQHDLPYQRAKRWLRHPATRWLLARLPLGLALRTAARARARSAAVVRQGDQSRFLPTAAAVGAAFATGVSRLVFGHIHRHSHGRHGGGEYWVLPAFDASATGLLLRDGAAAPVRFHGTDGEPEPVPLPSPCPFRA